MSTNNDPDRDPLSQDSPENSRLEPQREAPTESAREFVVAEPSSVEPGTLEPVVVRTGVEPEQGAAASPGWTSPAVSRETEDPNPYVVRTTVPPMNPHTTGAPLAQQTEGSAPPAAPNAAPGIPGGEIYSQAPAPVYVARPAQPVRRGNRLFGTVIALLGTVAFAVVYAAVASLFFVFNPAVENAVSTLTRFLVNFAFIVPVFFFAIAFILLVLILNRAGWWAYIIGGFAVAAVVYAGSIVGAYLAVQGWTMSQSDLGDFLRSLLMDPLPIVAAIVAREVSVWTGAWVSSRGRKVKERNQAAQAEYDKTMAEAPVTAPQGSPAW
ncbi:hypothetical protein SAMN06295879_1417 [Agreia bicolorata]|uniref:Uncharacterized protein n=1 Tax=Agreia bicolorata TaxID=110935 RepID=A0A1T4XNS8_9MICO|nr:hypothetical protein [Agreia bicolorata]SKA91033.1 hypothetical protein SAMN06295879_1417 [Agreia bicolorata]